MAREGLPPQRMRRIQGLSRRQAIDALAFLHDVGTGMDNPSLLSKLDDALELGKFGPDTLLKRNNIERRADGALIVMPGGDTDSAN